LILVPTWSHNMIQIAHTYTNQVISTNLAVYSAESKQRPHVFTYTNTSHNGTIIINTNTIEKLNFTTFKYSTYYQNNPAETETYYVVSVLSYKGSLYASTHLRYLCICLMVKAQSWLGQENYASLVRRSKKCFWYIKHCQVIVASGKQELSGKTYQTLLQNKVWNNVFIVLIYKYTH